jgi:xanthine dehydrogenase accessory factor
VAAYLRGAGLAEERLARLKAPAGLDLGAAEPAEIALSIMAEIVQIRRQADKEIAREEAAPITASATDPVCGMTVEVATARYTAEHEGQRFYFCCAGCKRSFEQQPEKYLVPVVSGQ